MRQTGCCIMLFFFAYFYHFNLVFMKKFNCLPDFNKAVKNKRPVAGWVIDDHFVKLNGVRSDKEIIKETLEKIIGNTNVSKHVN